MPRQKCTDWVMKYRFDVDTQMCRRHWWGGCEDNGNVFDTEEECEMSCLQNVVTVEPDEVDKGLNVILFFKHILLQKNIDSESICNSLNKIYLL